MRKSSLFLAAAVGALVCVSPALFAQMTGPSNPMMMGKVPKTLSFISSAINPVCSAGCPYNSVSFGTAQPDRYIIACLDGSRGGGTGTINTVTMNGGISATKIADVIDGTSDTRQTIWIANLPTGTSGDVTPTWSLNPTRQGGGFYRVTGLAAAAAFASGTSGSIPGTTTIATLQGGFAVACAYGNQTGTSWTNVNQDFTQVEGTNYTSAGASVLTTGASLAITRTYGGSVTHAAMAAVSF